MNAHAQEQQTSSFGLPGCNLAAAALFDTTALMAKYGNEIQKLKNDFKIQLATQYGGLDGNEGLVQKFLSVAFQAADEASDAIKDEAKGYLFQGITGAAAVGLSGAAMIKESWNNREPEAGIEEGKSMQNALKESSKDEEYDLDVYDKSNPRSKEIQERANDWKVDRSSLDNYKNPKATATRSAEKEKQLNEDTISYLKGKDRVQKQIDADGKSDLDTVRGNLDKKIEMHEGQINRNSQTMNARTTLANQASQAAGNIGQYFYKGEQASDQAASQKDQANQEVIKQVVSSYEQQMSDAQRAADEAKQQADQAAEAFGSIMRNATKA